MRDEIGHDNADNGPAARREYTADLKDESAPLYTNDCPGCIFVGCHRSGETRYDLFVCDRPAGGYALSVVARHGHGPQDYAEGGYIHHVGTTSTVASTQALIRAADLALERGLVPDSYGTPLAPEIHALLNLLARPGDGSDEGDARRAVGVYQAPGTKVHFLQLGFAVAAAERLGLRTLVVYRRLTPPDLEHFRTRACTLGHVRTVGVLERGDAPEQASACHLTLASADAFDDLLSAADAPAADLFDVIIIGEGYTFRHQETLQRVGDRFSGARLILLWTALLPAGVNRQNAATTGSITVFDAERLRDREPEAGDDTTFDLGPMPGLFAGYPLAEWGGERELWAGRLGEYGDLERPRSTCTFDLNFTTSLGGAPPADDEQHEYPHDRLPPLEEMKTARVLVVTPATGHVALALNRILDERPAEPGMYVLTPEQFADECEVAVTTFGYFAVRTDDDTRHEFRVWPSATIREAEAAYRRELERGKLTAPAIARVSRPRAGAGGGLRHYARVAAGRKARWDVSLRTRTAAATRAPDSDRREGAHGHGRNRHDPGE